MFCRYYNGLLSLRRFCRSWSRERARIRTVPIPKRRYHDQKEPLPHLTTYHVLWKPAIFTAGVCLVSFSSSFIYFYMKRQQPKKDGFLWEERWSRKQGLFRDIMLKIKKRWNYFNGVEKAAIGLIAVNVAVFLLWRIQALQPMMIGRFLADPYSRASFPMLLSTFSHIEVWHLLLNMVVLWNFFIPYMFIRSPEVALPFYVSAGVFASFAGHLAKVARGIPVPSLGASGSIMAIVASVVYNYPDNNLYFIFLPWVPIPASWALGTIVAIDVLGLIRGWKYFDHAAHLGGVLFGWTFESMIVPKISAIRHQVISSWSKFRN